MDDMVKMADKVGKHGDRKTLYNRLVAVTCLALGCSAWNVFAFVPPQDTKEGVTLQIEGFDETRKTAQLETREVPSGEPLPFTVSLRNSRKEPVKGTVTVWLNDDWEIIGKNTAELSAAAEGSVTALFTAKAKDRVLSALYPIHAKLELALGGKSVEFHPIAVFRAVRPAKAAVPDEVIVCGDPVIVLGAPLVEPMEEEWLDRENKARQYARDEVKVLRTWNGSDGRRPISFRLCSGEEYFGAGVEMGSQGLIDGVIAFTSGRESLAYRGFTVCVDGHRIGAGDDGLRVEQVSARLDSSTWEITHNVRMKGGVLIPLRARLWVEGASLRVAWDMPDVQRDKRGAPRYTNLALGSGSCTVWRAYAGFGWVFEDPAELSIPSGGLGLTGRHVAADYDNGLSLLQAVSVFPDRLTYERRSKTFALETHGDNIFTFVPATKGAFAAARRFAAISGYKSSKGVADLIGKQCLDEWGGDYGRAASGLALAGRYGLHDAVFVKHDWQRWGYDYRLPEIFPPHGSMSDFQLMRNAAKQAGILFVPHDNYIDFYPDAEGFSYDKIAFNGDGTPKLAWYNPGPRAQSYRWLPHGFTSALRENMKKMHDSFQPDGIFIDVFSSRPPTEYYDREGTYYPKSRTAEEWGRAFDSCREVLGTSGPMIGEGGTDALIGYLDAGEADHVAPSRMAHGYKNAERVPWHDMVTHGRMILFAGGLGARYSDAEPWQLKGDNNKLHGYGSDDYLSNTVIGGRNPMSDGPFSRRAVMTYWLLHDVCTALGRETFELHEFGKTIQRQHTVFSHGCEVWTNRGSNEWVVAGFTLPQYGFYAKTSNARAGVLLLRGQRAGFAESDILSISCGSDLAYHLLFGQDAQ